MPQRLIERHPVASNTDEEWLARRRGDLTASVIAGLFGFHPRETIYGLYNRLAGGPVLDVPNNAAIERGNDLEEATAKKWQRAHPEFRIRRAGVYLRDPALRLGATPDYFLTRLADNAHGVLEIKTVAPFIFKKFWNADAPPMWIVLQCLVQMMLARASFGKIAAWEIDGYRNKLHEYDVSRHPVSEQRIIEAVEEFWHCVGIGKVPEPDYSRDGALIAAMSPNAKEGSVIDLRHDNMMPELLDERAKLKQAIEAAEKRAKAIDAEIKAKMGENESALVNGWRVTLKNVHKDPYHVKEQNYRQLRATRDENYTLTDDGTVEIAASDSADVVRNPKSAAPA